MTPESFYKFRKINLPFPPELVYVSEGSVVIDIYARGNTHCPIRRLRNGDISLFVIIPWYQNASLYDR